MGKWNCLKCGWEGDEPKTVDPYNDGGWKECPACRNYATLNFNHVENMNNFAEALFGRAKK